MSCILRISGEYLDIDHFIKQSGIVPVATYYKGQPKFRSDPEGAKYRISGCNLPANDADFGDFNKQVEDVVAFLKQNYTRLQHINSTPGIQFATLDFGITYDYNKWIQTKKISLQLIRLCSELGIDVGISIYQPGEE